MSKVFELGEGMSSNASSLLRKKSIEQIKHEIGHYQSQRRSANVQGRSVLRFQLQKLDKLIRGFESQNKSVAQSQFKYS